MFDEIFFDHNNCSVFENTEWSIFLSPMPNGEAQSQILIAEANTSLRPASYLYGVAFYSMTTRERLENIWVLSARSRSCKWTASSTSLPHLWRRVSKRELSGSKWQVRLHFSYQRFSEFPHRGRIGKCLPAQNYMLLFLTNKSPWNVTRTIEPLSIKSAEQYFSYSSTVF